MVVEIVGGRASTGTLVDAVDSALRTGLPGLSVRLELAVGDARREKLERLCGADPRVAVVAPGAEPASPEVRIAMPPAARPEPRTLAAIVDLIRADGLSAVEVPVPGRFLPRSRAGKVRAVASGSGTKRLRPADVGMRSARSRGAPGPPPIGSLAAERAEHLRYRAQGATMRARTDRHAHRLSRERLQTRHERARLHHAEQRLGEGGPWQWLLWRARMVGRVVARIPGAFGSGVGSVRGYFRRARRFAANRWRARGAED